MSNLSFVSLACPMAVITGIGDDFIHSNNSNLSKEFEISVVFPPPRRIRIRSNVSRGVFSKLSIIEDAVEGPSKGISISVMLNGIYNCFIKSEYPCVFFLENKRIFSIENQSISFLFLKKSSSIHCFFNSFIY